MYCYAVFFVIRSSKSVCRKQDHSNEDVQLGVTSNGLAVFQNSVKTNTFFWYAQLLLLFTDSWLISQ